MTADDVIAARRTLGLTPDALAAELGLTPAVVAAWEAGAVAVPRRFARDLAWRLAAAEREAALAASGLPECAWVGAWASAPAASAAKAQLARLEALQAHAAACPECRAREAYVADRFPAMPAPPVAGWVAALGWVSERVDRLPPWLRPAANGALLFLALTAVRVLLGLPRLAAAPNGWLVALQALAAGAAIGAVLGSVVGAVRYARARLDGPGADPA